MSEISKAARIVQRVLALAGDRMGNNQYSADNNLSISVSVTGSSTLDSTFTKFYPAIGGDQPWNLLGGEPAADATKTDMVRLLCKTTYITPSVLVEGHVGLVEAVIDGDAAIFVLEAGKREYRFLVEEEGGLRYVSRAKITTGAVVSGTGKAYYKLAFSTSQRRRIAVELNVDGSNQNLFGGVYVKDGAQLFKPAAPTIRATFVSDSNLAGTSGPTGDNHGSIAAANLGIKDAWISSVGSTGSVIGSGGQPKWSQRDGDWLENDSDIIAFVLPWTDYNIYQDDETIPTAVLAAVARARDQRPDAIITVMGYVWAIEAERPIEWLAINAAIKAGIEALDDNYIRYLDVQGAKPFYGDYTPVGNILGYVNSSTDGHWNTAGNYHLGEHHAQRMLEAFEAMYLGAALVVEEPASPSLSSTSGSQSYTVAVAKSVDLATVSDGVLGTIASVTPALPSGVAASVTGSGTKLSLAGTATAAVAATSHVIVVNVVGGGTLTYTLSLTVNAAATPALSATSGSQSATVGVAKSVDLATAVDCTLASIASVTPALPAGLSATVGTSGTKIHLGGTGTAATASASYVIVANVTGGGTLTFTLTLVVAAASTGTVFDVNFSAVSSSATSHTDSTGTVWTPTGGATLNGVIPSGGSIETVTSATLAAAALGTGPYQLEVSFTTTKAGITLWDLGAAIGLPIGSASDGGTAAKSNFWSSSAGYHQALMTPLSTDFASGSPITVKWFRNTDGTSGMAIWTTMGWANFTDTHSYGAPAKITLGLEQGSTTADTFVGTIISAKLKKSSDFE